MAIAHGGYDHDLYLRAYRYERPECTLARQPYGLACLDLSGATWHQDLLDPPDRQVQPAVWSSVAFKWKSSSVVVEVERNSGSNAEHCCRKRAGP